jgi:hypothetical protein
MNILLPRMQQSMHLPLLVSFALRKRMDRKTDKQTEGRTDEPTDNVLLLCPQD